MIVTKKAQHGPKKGQHMDSLSQGVIVDHIRHVCCRPLREGGGGVMCHGCVGLCAYEGTKLRCKVIDASNANSSLISLIYASVRLVHYLIHLSLPDITRRGRQATEETS